MTEDTMKPPWPAGEDAVDSDFLREMIGFSAQRLMELEVESLTGARHGARDPDRLTHRNGYRERDWETRAGTANCAFRSCGRAATSPAFSNHGEWPRRHSPQ